MRDRGCGNFRNKILTLCRSPGNGFRAKRRKSERVSFEKRRSHAGIFRNGKGSRGRASRRGFAEVRKEQTERRKEEERHSEASGTVHRADDAYSDRCRTHFRRSFDRGKNFPVGRADHRGGRDHQRGTRRGAGEQGGIGDRGIERDRGEYVESHP